MDEKLIIAGLRIDEPFSYPCAFDPSKCPNGTGVNFDLFQEVMRMMGFKYKLVPAEENESGYKDRNGKYDFGDFRKYTGYVSGTWRGLIGQLLRHKIDMTASLITVEPEDGSYVIEYSAPATYLRRAFLIQIPDPNEHTVSPWFLATTFKPLVWLCFLSVLLIYIFLLFMARMLAVSKSQRKPWYYLSDSVLDVLRSPLNQMEPWAHVAPLRLTLNYMNTPVFILMNFYTAYLTGSLMILGQPPDPFSGVNGLSKLIYDRKFTLVKIHEFGRGLRGVPMANHSQDPEDLIKISANWNPPVLARDISEAVNMVANNKTLVLRGSYEQLMHASAYSCRTKIIEDQDSVPAWLSFGFRKADPLQAMVSNILYNSTRLDKFMKSAYRNYLKRRHCDDQVKLRPKFFALGLKQLKYGFCFLIYGLTTCVPIFLLEFIIPKMAKLIQKFKKSKCAGGWMTKKPSINQGSVKNKTTCFWSSTGQLSVDRGRLWQTRRGSNTLSSSGSSPRF